MQYMNDPMNVGPFKEGYRRVLVKFNELRDALSDIESAAGIVGEWEFKEQTHAMIGRLEDAMIDDINYLDKMIKVSEKEADDEGKEEQ